MITKTEAFEVITISRAKIKNAEYNPRKINEKQLAGLKKNLKKVGIISPLVWNKQTGNLVSGHQRLRLIDDIEGGIDYELTVAVVDLDPKTEAEQNIFLNSTTYQGEFDLGKLKRVIEDFDLDYKRCGLDEFDKSIIGISDKELKMFSGTDISEIDDNGDEDESGDEYEMTDEDKKEYVKQQKAEIQDKYNKENEGETYITLSFSSYKNKSAFCGRFDIPKGDTVFKGEVFSEMIERVN